MIFDVAKAFAKTFESEAYQPFTLRGGTSGALLIHGFPGTPAEVRPLGDALHRAGWTAHGPLLPGFGADITTLPQRSHREWLAAAQDAFAQVRRDNHPTLLVGHSMGGALALQVAAKAPPDGLILLAPFWTLDHALWRLLPALKFIIPEFKPFTLVRLDLDDPETRAAVRKFVPDVDLDDPAVRKAIREFAIPTHIGVQVRAAGVNGYRCAPRVGVRTLVIQGVQDTLVYPRYTKRLIARLAGHVDYHEVHAEHDLPIPTAPAWAQVERLVVEFAQALLTD